MATVTVAHHPDLTLENATEVFKEHFGDKYEVSQTDSLGGLRRIVLEKSQWTAAYVSLAQATGKTSFVFGGFMPSWVSRIPIVGLIVTLFLRTSWKEIEEEVETFIKGAAAFN